MQWRVIADIRDPAAHQFDTGVLLIIYFDFRGAPMPMYLERLRCRFAVVRSM